MNKRHPLSLTTPALLLASLFIGCAGLNQSAPPTQDKAEILYNTGMEDLKDGLFPEAIKGFSEIRTEYPYSRFARLALLRIADANHERGKFNEAIDGYRNFLKYYPNHDLSEYAMLAIGHSYYKQLPLEWWFLPPGTEKDQANIRRAIAAYRETTLAHPDSKEAELARERVFECRKKLAEHELYVARFYFQREKFKATTLRSAYLLEHYPDLGFEPEALLLGARAFIQLNQAEPAREYLNKLLKGYKDSAEAATGHQLLLELQATPPRG